MKVLTLRQPRASLVALGVKTIETRSWRTQYRGRMIHDGSGRCHSSGAATRPVPARLGDGDPRRSIRPVTSVSTRPRGVPNGHSVLAGWWPQERAAAPSGRCCWLGDRSDPRSAGRTQGRRSGAQLVGQSVASGDPGRTLCPRRRAVTEVQGGRGRSNFMAALCPLWRSRRSSSWASGDPQPHERSGLRDQRRPLLALLPSIARTGATEAEA